MLSNFFQKVKQKSLESKTDLFTALVIFLIGMAGFGLGRLSAVWPEKKPIQIINNQLSTTNSEEEKEKTPSSSSPASLSDAISQRRYVASKSGTAYHFPWCPGALRIKEENKIWFETKEEAEKKGYKPAGNCQGL